MAANSDSASRATYGSKSHPVRRGISMQQHTISLKDYSAVLARRRGQIIAVMVPLLLISIALAVGLPSVYQSAATILVEQQNIPEDLVTSTVTSYADERIQLISRRVMSRDNLDKVIKKLKLESRYKEEAQEGIRAVRARLKQSTLLEMVSAEVVNPRSGREQQVTIAFTVSYEDKSPELAQQVANELAALYLEENRTSRVQLATDTAAFLQHEAEKVKTHMVELESRLATFKEENIGALPEQRDLNLQLIERTERELINVQNQIRTLEERKIYLESELAQVSPYNAVYSSQGDRVLTADGRLRSLQAEYASLSARYSPDHPDIVRMRREIQALEGQAGGGTDRAVLIEQVRSLQQQLAAAQERYASEHPDVKRLERAVAKAENELKASGTGASRGGSAAVPDNPAYIQLKANLEAAQSELQSLKFSETTLKRKLTTFENRINRAPSVEREYRVLMRDYENARSRYNEITTKQTTAELAKSLESEQKGDRFILLESPVVPEAPLRPNRLAIVLLGTILSIGGGIGTAAVTEGMDSSVRGRKVLTELLGTPPLAVIPYIETKADMRRKKWRRIATAVTSIFGFALLMVWAYSRLSPLNPAVLEQGTPDTMIPAKAVESGSENNTFK
ncbi:MAG: Wzz/FepE/Etk N-terminal domain-containing protein [Gammaproteobacteria bacterium]